MTVPIIERLKHMTKKNDWDVMYYHRNGLYYRTDGAAKYCGKELELNLPLLDKHANTIIKTIVDLCIEMEEEVSTNLSVREIGLDITFRMYPSLLNENETVWRVLVSDINGLHPDNPYCDPNFRRQLSEDNEDDYDF